MFEESNVSSFFEDKNISFINQITNNYTFTNILKNDNGEQNQAIKCDIGIQTVKKFEEIDDISEDSYIDYNLLFNKNNKIKNDIDKSDFERQFTNNYEEEKNNEDQDKETKLQINSFDICNNIVSTNNSFFINQKNKFFNINKQSKTSKLGRKSKRENSYGKHTKFGDDNIIRRIKVKFIDSSLNYINEQFKNKKLKLLKIVGNQAKETNKKKNLLWLKKTMKEVFYEDISKKTYNSNKNYNRELIDKIYFENDEKKVIKLLNLTVNDFLKFLYCSDIKIKGMNQLDEVVNELKNKGESGEYLKKFKNISKCFEETFINFHSRERKQK